MEHIHSVYDTDSHFKIDPITKKIECLAQKKVKLSKGDHESERFTFECPRHIEGHDMMECNVIEVHYINIDATDKTKTSKSFYTVIDKQTSEESDEVLIFSWLIEGSATKYVGTLGFSVRFACISNAPKIDYQWLTDINSSVSIGDTIFNSEYIATEYEDALAAWKEELECKIANAGAVKTVNGNEPNQSGDVQINVGVKTIDYREPDSDGAITVGFTSLNSMKDLLDSSRWGTCSLLLVTQGYNNNPTGIRFSGQLLIMVSEPSGGSYPFSAMDGEGTMYRGEISIRYNTISMTKIETECLIKNIVFEEYTPQEFLDLPNGFYHIDDVIPMFAYSGDGEDGDPIYEAEFDIRGFVKKEGNTLLCYEYASAIESIFLINDKICFDYIYGIDGFGYNEAVSFLGYDVEALETKSQTVVGAINELKAEIEALKGNS